DRKLFLPVMSMCTSPMNVEPGAWSSIRMSLLPPSAVSFVSAPTNTLSRAMLLAPRPDSATLRFSAICEAPTVAALCAPWPLIDRGVAEVPPRPAAPANGGVVAPPGAEPHRHAAGDKGFLDFHAFVGEAAEGRKTGLRARAPAPANGDGRAPERADGGPAAD